MRRFYKIRRTILALSCLYLLAGCGLFARQPSDVECLARAMYFESIRSSRDGMIAVGSVVMNRVESDAFPNSVCAVVSQKNQFAPGVMSKAMDSRSAPAVMAAAQAVYRGERHPMIANAQFFHAAWYDASFNNIQYVLTTGGNAFYEKRRPENVTSPTPLPPIEGQTGR